MIFKDELLKSAFFHKIDTFQGARDKVFHFKILHDDHITEVVSKCVAALCQIDRVKHSLDTKTMVTLVKTLVFIILLLVSLVQHF